MHNDMLVIAIGNRLPLESVVKLTVSSEHNDATQHYEKKILTLLL